MGGEVLGQGFTCLQGNKRQACEPPFSPLLDPETLGSHRLVSPSWDDACVGWGAVGPWPSCTPSEAGEAPAPAGRSGGEQTRRGPPFPLRTPSRPSHRYAS